MKLFAPLFALILFVATSALGQIAQGPASGSIPGGVIVNTNNFSSADWPPPPEPAPVRNKIPFPPVPPPPDVMPGTGPIGSNYIEFPRDEDGPPPITIGSFNGIAQTNSIPPDPHIAVGPNHIIQVVNTSFRITDKAGNTQKTITAAQWYSTTVAGVGPFDPKVHYDHFANRWVMVWLDQNDAPQRSYYLLSVSDDADPNGTWYNWALPGNTNGGTQTNNWSDYQGVGLDSLAYYFTSNQFVFGAQFSNTKVRIIPKAQLLLNNAGPVTWTDFWDLRDLNGNQTFGTRPSVVYGRPSEYYLIGRPYFTVGTFFVIYRITNPTGTPSIAAVHVPVTTFQEAPLASQLGGGAFPLESGGSLIRCEPIYRDNSLWMVHSVASGPGNSYSAVRYLRFSTLTNTAVEDVAAGIEGFWHLYPALAVDKDRNIAITFSRSGFTEYAGAYMSWRLAGDPAGVLRPTVTVQPGRGNYVVTFGGTRNRWGDYMGIKVDPSDESNFWMLTEYAAATNTWGVWVHGARLVPFPGVRINVTQTARNYGLVEVGKSSDTTTIYVYNIGAGSMTVSSIAKSSPAYTLLDLPTFPRTVATYDSIRFRVYFRPTAHGTVNDTIRIASNDPSSPETKIALTAKGVLIGRAQAGVLYSASSGSPAGSLYRLNTSTGTATLTGSLGVSDLGGLAVHPVTRELYGTRAAGAASEIHRVAEAYGDALLSFTIPLANLRGMAFYHADSAYAVTSNGALYKIVLSRRDTIGIGFTSPALAYTGLAIHPVTGQLWASVAPPVAGRDRIYTIDKTTGQATLIGSTGTGANTPGIAFNRNALLYGIFATGTRIDTLMTIRTDSAIGTRIGSTGVNNLTALAMRTDSAGAVPVDEAPRETPLAFTLEQNYPNPFNPETEIRFALPRESRVVLAVYNVVGQEVARLVDGIRPAGTHTARWNGRTAAGSAAPTGVYLYRIDAGDFTAVRKMILMK